MKFGNLFFSILLVVAACTPKTNEKITSVPTEPEKVEAKEPDKDLSPCKNWVGLSDQDNIMSAHVLYKDALREIRALKRKDASANAEKINLRYDDAFGYWKVAYRDAPAADGKRPDHFDDGIKFYEHYIAIAKTEEKKTSLINNIMEIYEERARCYGDAGYMKGAMAFDYYYKYPNRKSELEIYEMFKASMDIYQNNAEYFILNPFTAVLANLVIEEKIPISEAQKYVGYIKNSLKNGLEKADTPKKGEPWEIVNDYVPVRLAQLEGIKGFYDCAYYKDKYLSEWKDNATDCEAVVNVISKMKWGDCAEDDPDLVEAFSFYNPNCRTPTPTAAASCRSKLQDGDYRGAVDCYIEKGGSSDDPEKRAQYNLIAAKIFYGELKRFSDARKYALKALKDKPNWGDPYLLIGKLYASSGPLCGPGRGWDSQIVTWPAIDKWKKAKAVDPSVSAEANKLINRYLQYMPSVEDIFQRQLKNGDSFRVGCWIQENTTIRPAK